LILPVSRDSSSSMSSNGVLGVFGFIAGVLWHVQEVAQQ
jgi:hypothetical protein